MQVEDVKAIVYERNLEKKQEIEAVQKEIKKLKKKVALYSKRKSAVEEELFKNILNFQENLCDHEEGTDIQRDHISGDYLNTGTYITQFFCETCGKLLFEDRKSDGCYG